MKGNSQKRKRDESQEISVIIDCGGEFSESEMIGFLQNLFKEKYKSELEFQKKSNVNGMFCLLFSNPRELREITDLNGTEYLNGQKLLITQLFLEKYGNQLSKLEDYFDDNYKGGTFNFTDMQKAFSPDLKFNYYPDFQFILFYLGVYARRMNIRYKTIDFTRNNLRNINLFRNIRIFLPRLGKIILDKNPITETDKITDVLSGIDVKFNDLHFGAGSYEDDENGFPDVTREKRNSRSDSDSYHHSDNSDRSDDDNRSDSDNSERDRYSSPNREYSDENDRSDNDNDNDSEDNRNDYSSQHSDDDQSEPEDTGKPDTSFSEVKAFLFAFINQSRESIDHIHGFYTNKAAFSFMIRSTYVGDSLFTFKDNNQNLVYHSPKDSVTVGDRNIALKQFELFPDGFDFSLNNIHANKVENLFYVVTFDGTLSIKNQNHHVNRILTIIGENGQLLISNDVLFLS